MMEEKPHSCQELADLLHVTVRTVRRYVREGKLRATRIGKTYYIHDGEFHDFLDRGTAAPRVQNG